MSWKDFALDQNCGLFITADNNGVLLRLYGEVTHQKYRTIGPTTDGNGFSSQKKTVKQSIHYPCHIHVYLDKSGAFRNKDSVFIEKEGNVTLLNDNTNPNAPSEIEVKEIYNTVFKGGIRRLYSDKVIWTEDWYFEQGKLNGDACTEKRTTTKENFVEAVNSHIRYVVTTILSRPSASTTRPEPLRLIPPQEMPASKVGKPFIAFYV